VFTYCVKSDVRIEFGAVRSFPTLPHYFLVECARQEVLRDIGCAGRGEAAEWQEKRDRNRPHRVDVQFNRRRKDSNRIGYREQED